MKKSIYLIIVLLGLYLVVQLSRSILDLLKRQERIDMAKKTLSQEEKKYSELLAKKQYVEKDAFLEKEAREKLLLGKPGESRVIIDKTLIEAVNGTSSAEAVKDSRPNWQKWLELLFK